jgi:hemoglobin
MADETEIYAAVGGDAPFFELVDAFYRSVDLDPPLRALYPADLGPGKLHLAWFLIQRFGGPELFNQRRGAPRLRMRHAGFPITTAMRDAWFGHMLDAIDEVAVFAPYKDVMRDYFDHSATFLINRDEPARGNVRLEIL